MATPRTPRATPERRRSQFFSSFNLTPRSSKIGHHESSSPTTASKRTASPALDSTTSVPVDLDVLLQDLNTGALPHQRTVAAAKVTAHLKDFKLDRSDAFIIYKSVFALIHTDDVVCICHGYKLLGVLLTTQDFVQYQRLDILGSLTPLQGPLHKLFRPSVLSEVLNGGRNIDGLEQNILKILSTVMQDCIDLCHDSTFDRNSFFTSLPDSVPASSLGIPSPTDASSTILNLIVNTIKFGPSLSTTYLPQLLKDIYHTIKTNPNNTDTVNFLNIIAAVAIYDHIPSNIFPLVIQCLCHLYHEASNSNKPQIQEQVWKTFSMLFSTHLQSACLGRLMWIQENKSGSDVVTFHEANGALQLVARLLSDMSHDVTDKIDLDKLVNAFDGSFGVDAINVPVELGLLLTLVRRQHLKQRLITELDWDKLVKAIAAISQSLGPPDGSTQPQHLLLEHLLCGLDDLPDLSSDQTSSLQALYLTLAPALPDVLSVKLLQRYERSMEADDFEWEMRRLANGFILVPDVALTIRLDALEALQSACLQAQWRDARQGKFCAGLVLEILESGERDTDLQERLIHCALEYHSESLEEDDYFGETVQAMCRSLANKDKPKQQFSSKHVTKGLVVLFMRSMNRAADRSHLLFITILDILETAKLDPAATVMLLRGLFRIRSDVQHRIFMISSPEGEGLAATLYRSNPAPTGNSRRPSRHSTLSESAPVWMYGEILGLPENPPASVSEHLYSKFITGDQHGRNLNMAKWLDHVLLLLEHGTNWEVYSYVIVHLGAQLTNQSLFTEAIPQIQRLRKLICKQILGQSFPKPPEGSELKQADVAVCLYHVLTMLIGYHEHFSRPETEEMISAFITGMSAWDRSTVHCVHALTLCCYELSDSLRRDLIRIITQMSTIVTKSDAAIHVLEFLAGLSRLTELARIFHGDEIKTVFGVCFSYIDYVRGRRFDESQQRAKSAAGARQSSTSAELFGSRPSTEEIPEYVFALAYHVIAFWYLTLKEQDRDKYMPWMQQRLLSVDQAGVIEEQGLVTFDLIWRTTKRNKTTAALTRPAALPSGSTASWISHYSLLTIVCGPDKQSAEVIERRASGTDEWRITLTQPSSPQEIFDGTFAAGLDRPFPKGWDPQRLQENDAVKRALTMFDRTSAVDIFKAGVVYVGENQSQEAEILGNVMGSPDYNLLLKGLGERLHLQGLAHSSAGLDTSELRTDGPSTIWYRSDLTVLIYHITTFMPTDKQSDPGCVRKKSHIGNDYVNIVFNNSGRAFNFDTFPSAFNYVYIVITPEARATFIETRTRLRDPGWFERSWFKVQVLTRSDFPNISSAAETKVVSGKVLAVYVRNLALNACVFCNVWANRGGGGDYPSSWRARLTQLKLLRERYAVPVDGA